VTCCLAAARRAPCPELLTHQGPQRQNLGRRIKVRCPVQAFRQRLKIFGRNIGQARKTLKEPFGWESCAASDILVEVGPPGSFPGRMQLIVHRRHS
jgi:hypothetical protein